jgi:hypothetical protein
VDVLRSCGPGRLLNFQVVGAEIANRLVLVTNTNTLSGGTGRKTSMRRLLLQALPKLLMRKGV